MDRLLEQLKDYLTKLAPGGLCVAFSGGVDSSLLLKLACMTTDDVHAVPPAPPSTPLPSPARPGRPLPPMGRCITCSPPNCPGR